MKYEFIDSQKNYSSDFGIITSRGMQNFDRNFYQKYYSHMSAEEIKKIIGDEKFNNYIKFCVVRNPYDKMVSRYFWDLKNNKTNKGFDEYCQTKNVSDINLYTINGKSVCNFIIRYEHLEEDIIKLCQILDIKYYNIQDLPYHKKTQRDRDYRNYYNENTRRIVYENHKDVFLLYNYEF
jgi:hypothetical protein